MSDGRLFFGRKALWPRVAFFCTWWATAKKKEGRREKKASQATSEKAGKKDEWQSAKY